MKVEAIHPVPVEIVITLSVKEAEMLTAVGMFDATVSRALEKVKGTTEYTQRDMSMFLHQLYRKLLEANVRVHP